MLHTGFLRAGCLFAGLEFGLQAWCHYLIATIDWIYNNRLGFWYFAGQDKVAIKTRIRNKEACGTVEKKQQTPHRLSDLKQHDTVTYLGLYFLS